MSLSSSSMRLIWSPILSLSPIMNSTWSRKAWSWEFCVGQGLVTLKWIHDDSDWCLTNRLIDSIVDSLILLIFLINWCSPPIHCDQQDGLNNHQFLRHIRPLFQVPLFCGVCGGHPTVMIRTSTVYWGYRRIQIFLQYFSDYQCIYYGCFQK